MFMPPATSHQGAFKIYPAAIQNPLNFKLDLSPYSTWFM